MAPELQNLKEFRHESLQAMVDAVYAGIHEFRRQTSPADDISFLAVEYGA